MRARSSELDADSQTILMAVLDWKEGYFELASGVQLDGVPDLESTVTHLLMEHARRTDEAARS